MIENNGENRLIDFVDLNEKIKQLVTLASDVELMSMNALLANKHANGRSGFSAVAYELRGFSLDVIDGAKQLSIEFSLIISQIALDGNLNRRARILNETQAKSQTSSQYLVFAQSDVQGFLKSSYLKFEHSVNNAAKLLLKIERLTLVGGNLSRVGKIESTYLGGLGVMLYQIAQDVGNIIVEIFQLIIEVQNRVKGYLI